MLATIAGMSAGIILVVAVISQSLRLAGVIRVTPAIASSANWGGPDLVRAGSRGPAQARSVVGQFAPRTGQKIRSSPGAAAGHHENVAGSFRSDPRRVRAARRAVFPAVRARRPAPGRHHPATAADVRATLEAFGAPAYYGIRLIELIPSTPGHQGLSLGRLVGPGHVMLFDQPPSPWRLGSAVPAPDRAWLASAGADVSRSAAGVVTWPGDSLRRFMLGHVLAHEIGHHLLQHERRRPLVRAAPTRDHEARAEVVAAALRDRLGWA
jgi:hypothetical protein